MHDKILDQISINDLKSVDGLTSGGGGGGREGVTWVLFWYGCASLPQSYTWSSKIITYS